MIFCVELFCLLVPCLPSATSLCLCVCLCVYRASIQAYVQVMIRELLHYSVAKLSKVCLVRLQSRQETKSDEYVVFSHANCDEFSRLRANQNVKLDAVEVRGDDDTPCTRSRFPFDSLCRCNILIDF
jgi:hypothetical protein